MPEAELPIDIDYAKLVGWLVDRQKIPSDWRKRLAQVQTRASAAMLTISPQLTSGKDLDAPTYTMVAEVLASLVAEGGAGGAKNFLGQRTGPARELELVLALYKKHALHWGETAQILAQLTDYEVPFLRKQMAKNSHQLEDLSRKEAETKRGVTGCKAAYTAACQQLGIEGTDVRRELNQLPAGLADVFRTAVQTIRGAPVVEAVEHYADFVQYAHCPEGGGTAADATLPTMQEVQLMKESVAFAPDVGISAELGLGESSTPVEINWDLGMEAGKGGDASAPVDIDWDVGAEAGGSGDASAPVDTNWDVGVEAGDGGDASAPVDINWDVGMEAGDRGDASAPVEINWDVGMEAGDVGDASAPVEINWDVGMEAGDGGDASAPVEINWDIGMEASAPVEINWDIGVSTEETALSSSTSAKEQPKSVPGRLMAAEYRNRVVEELLELQAFLSVRTSELRSTRQLTALASTKVPKSIREQSLGRVEEMQAEVEAALKRLTCKTTRDLLLIKSSGRYKERLLATLEGKQGQEVKLKRSLMEMNEKREEILTQLASHSGREKGLLARLQALKGMLEKEISVQYKGRPVNIIGEVNNLLG